MIAPTVADKLAAVQHQLKVLVQRYPAMIGEISPIYENVVDVRRSVEPTIPMIKKGRRG